MHLLEGFQRLFDQGGLVLTVIMIVSIIMWTFIIERYLYLYFIHPRQLKQRMNDWSGRKDHTSWYAKTFRQGLVSEINSGLQKKPFIDQNSRQRFTFTWTSRHRHRNDLNF